VAWPRPPVVFDVELREGAKVKRVLNFENFCRRLGGVLEEFEFLGGEL
jgi:hypothetical protein